MTAPLAVAIDSNQSAWAASLIASLPVSFRLVTMETADVLLIDGVASWTDRAEILLGQGNGHIFVVDPDIADADAIHRLADVAERHGAAVTLSESYAGNPAIAGFQEWIDDRFANVTLYGRGAISPQSMLFQQVRIARAVGLPVSRIDRTATTPDAVCATARSVHGENGLALLLSAVRTHAVAPQHQLMIQGCAAMAQLNLFDGRTARPAEAILIHREGSTILPSIFETAHRATLQGLASTSPHAVSALRAFAEDAEAVRSIFSDKAVVE